jgi:hypothetical protein
MIANQNIHMMKNERDDQLDCVLLRTDARLLLIFSTSLFPILCTTHFFVLFLSFFLSFFLSLFSALFIFLSSPLLFHLLQDIHRYTDTRCC